MPRKYTKSYSTVPWEVRFWAKVNKTETCWLWTASTSDEGYGNFRKGRMMKAHRVSYEDTYGPIPPRLRLDHTCHEPSCVRPDHLRPATDKQNAENRQGAQANSKSGIRGVTWNRERGRWSVQVRHNQKLHFFGYYTGLQEAAEVARLKRIELFTHNDVDRIGAAQ